MESRLFLSLMTKTIRLWDSASGQQVGAPLEGHTNVVKGVAYSPDRNIGKHIVSASRDKTLRIWDVTTGQQVGVALEGHTYEINAVAYSPDGKHIVSGSQDQTLRLWDAATGLKMEYKWKVMHTGSGQLLTHQMASTLLLGLKTKH